MRRFLIMGLLMVASLAQAEYISWRVYIDTGNSFYDSARLFATTEGTADVGTGIAQGDAATARESVENGVTPTDTALSVGSGYSFFVALYSGGLVVGYSEIRSWAALATETSLWTGNLPAPMGTVYWNAVPEPTSIGLLAMGMSALLLRRRRRV